MKVALIGAGKMAREHARAFQAIEGVTIIGVHSRTPASTEAFAREMAIPLVARSIEELYAKTTADAVVVAVPELAARAVSFESFQYPWSVLLEKPPGYDLADARAIEAEANRTGRTVYVALNRRFLSSTRAALEGLQQDPGPRLIQVADQENRAEARFHNHPETVIDNWMYANSIHLVDYLRVFGRGRVTGVRSIMPWEGPETRYVAAFLEFESGDRAGYTCIWRGPGPWAVSVTTENTRWEMRPLEQASYQLAGDRTLHPVAVSESDRAFKPGFLLQARSLIRAIRGEASDIPTIKEAMETMSLIGQIYGT